MVKSWAATGGGSAAGDTTSPQPFTYVRIKKVADPTQCWRVSLVPLGLIWCGGGSSPAHHLTKSKHRDAREECLAKIRVCGSVWVSFCLLNSFRCNGCPILNAEIVLTRRRSGYADNTINCRRICKQVKALFSSYISRDLLVTGCVLNSVCLRHVWLAGVTTIKSDWRKCFT